jgi:protein-S-isoprenylcysteine O-methyltransferase Ste14
VTKKRKVLSVSVLLLLHVLSVSVLLLLLLLLHVLSVSVLLLLHVLSVSVLLLLHVLCSSDNSVKKIKKYKSKSKRKSGIYDKPSDEVVKKQLWPQSMLHYEYAGSCLIMCAYNCLMSFHSYNS